jgi:hypothetical protein
MIASTEINKLKAKNTIKSNQTPQTTTPDQTPSNYYTINKSKVRILATEFDDKTQNHLLVSNLCTTNSGAQQAQMFYKQLVNYRGFPLS